MIKKNSHRERRVMKRAQSKNDSIRCSSLTTVHNIVQLFGINQEKQRDEPML